MSKVRTCQECKYCDNERDLNAFCTYRRKCVAQDEELCQDFVTKEGKVLNYFDVIKDVASLAENLICVQAPSCSFDKTGYFFIENPLNDMDGYYIYKSRQDCYEAIIEWLMEEKKE